MFFLINSENSSQLYSLLISLFIVGIGIGGSSGLIGGAISSDLVISFFVI
jgi:hypothetical protein